MKEPTRQSTRPSSTKDQVKPTPAPTPVQEDPDQGQPGDEQERKPPRGDGIPMR